MSGPILVIRPEPGSTATVEAGRRAGLAIEACPLLEIGPLAWDAPPAGEIDGLLLGSANAVRHAGPALEAFRGRPVYAVGKATAAAAEAFGFDVAATGSGSLQAVLDSAVHPPLRLLRLAGEEHIALVPPPGVTVELRQVYRAMPLPLPDAMAERLSSGALVLLHSAAAARHFAEECDRRSVSRAAVHLAALGPRIAAAAGGGWCSLRSAAMPNEPALLALARDMCHEMLLR